MTTIDTAYSDKRQEKYYEIEDVSWWFSYRAEVFLYMAREYFDNRVMTYDIGGSNGYNSKKLIDAGFDVTMIEPTKEACDNARLRGIQNVLNLPFQLYNGEISQFVLLDVLEHIDDDKGFLDMLSKKSQNGKKQVGIISVPAFMSLWSSEDVVDGHFRRYTKKQLTEVVNSVGYNVVYMDYFYHFLWLPIYIRRHLMEKLPFIHKVYDRSEQEEKEVTDKQFIVDGLIKSVLNCLESYELGRIKRKKRIWFGSSIICVVEYQT